MLPTLKSHLPYFAGPEMHIKGQGFKIYILLGEDKKSCKTHNFPFQNSNAVFAKVVSTVIMVRVRVAHLLGSLVTPHSPSSHEAEMPAVKTQDGRMQFLLESSPA